MFWNIFMLQIITITNQIVVKIKRTYFVQIKHIHTSSMTKTPFAVPTTRQLFQLSLQTIECSND